MSLEIALKPFQKLKCFQNNIFVDVKAVIYITFIALKDELLKMIGSNNEKTLICISFYAADEKLCKYEKSCEKFVGEKTKNQDKLIQTRTAGQHTKNRDSWNV